MTEAWIALRGGKVDVAALSAELNCPVALISASRGTGIESIQQFLLGTAVRLNAPPVRIELPVLQDVPKCRQWAAKLGVRAIPAKGEPFDPHVHEAIEMVETSDAPDHEVIEELQRGYKLKDRLLRPAMVKVAKNP